MKRRTRQLLEGKWEVAAEEELGKVCALMVGPLQFSPSSTPLLAVLFGLREAQFPYLQNGYNYSMDFIGLL